LSATNSTKKMMNTPGAREPLCMALAMRKAVEAGC
jgi:thiazole synthase ThiGH ThiG subunit